MPDMCSECLKYVLGDLDDLRRKRFERHLSSCGKCQVHVVELEELVPWVMLDESPEYPQVADADGVENTRRPLSAVVAGMGNALRPSLIYATAISFFLCTLFATAEQALAAPIMTSVKLQAMKVDNFEDIFLARTKNVPDLFRKLVADVHHVGDRSVRRHS